MSVIIDETLGVLDCMCVACGSNLPPSRYKPLCDLNSYPGADGIHAGLVEHCVFNVREWRFPRRRLHELLQSSYGQGIPQYGRPPCEPAPKRDGCTPKYEAKKIDPPYLTCGGKCASDNCWTCPEIPGTNSAYVGGFANKDFFECK